MNETLTSQLNRAQAISLIIGIIGLALLAIGAVNGAQQFFISYLFGCICSGWNFHWVCLAIAMIHYLTSGRWGRPWRAGFWEAGFMTLPLMALLFMLPFFLVWTKLYP